MGDMIIGHVIDEDKLTGRAQIITDRIYQRFASDSGILFGIPSDRRRAVELIVQTALEEYLENYIGEEVA